MESRKLAELIETHFDMAEIDGLIFDLGEWEDNVPGETREAKARHLVGYAERRKLIPRLLELLQAEREQVDWLGSAADDLPCPYRGLQAFRPEDAHLFFGREVVATRLVEKAWEEGLVALVGSSGSGKSSVVMAGMVPKLQEGGKWVVAVFRPGERPFESLAGALLPLLYPEKTKVEQLAELNSLAEMLHGGKVSLVQVVEWILREQKGETKFLLVADQFEELYTLCLDSQMRHDFLDRLLAAVVVARDGAEASHHVALTLRSDFLGQVQEDYAAFVDALQRGMVLMRPMVEEDLRQAIEWPALQAGVRFEKHLVKRVLVDVAEEPGQLPLLEFALTLMWEKLEEGVLSLAAYEEIGRVEGALARYAERVFGELKEAEQAAARRVFLKLVQVGEGVADTRRVATKGEIGAQHWPLVAKLASARLVVTGRNAASEDTVEVVHEALIGRWQRLQAWVNEDRMFLTQWRRVQRAYQQWQEGGQDEGDLLGGTLLRQASEWLEARADNLGVGEIQYIEASLQHEEDSLKQIWRMKIFVGEVEGEDLVGLDLSGLTLGRAPLAGMTLRDISLYEADLREADLRGTDLRGTDLKAADLSGADLRGTDLREARIDDRTQIEDKWRIVWEIVNQVGVGKNLRGADLRGANLSGADLSGADLSGADLSGADLRGADLRGADLRETMIDNHTHLEDKWRVVWKIVNQGGVGKSLREADLSGADLSGADLKGADLSGADLKGSHLREAYLRKAKIDDRTQIEDKWRVVWEIVNQGGVGKNLRNADLSGADLREAYLNRADLREADLRGADLRETDLRGADLRGAKIDDSTQIGNKWRVVWEIVNQGGAGKNLREADLRGADLSGADLSGADLSWAHLRGADLSGADLKGTDLGWAHLRGAKIDDRTQIEDKWRVVWEIVNQSGAGKNLTGSDLRGSDLWRADLSSADLSGANLGGANLSGADLSWAHLNEADLSGANLSGADLSWAHLRGAKIDDRTRIEDKWRVVWEIVNQGGAGKNLRGADLRGADLGGADLRGADLRGADIRGVNLRGVDPRWALCDSLTQWPQGFDPQKSGVIWQENRGQESSSQ